MSKMRRIAFVGSLLAIPATWAVDLQPATGQPVPGLTPAQLAAFNRGKVAFQKQFTIAEGLGPTLNKNGCASCHSVGGTGGSGNITVTRFGFVDAQGNFDPLDELGGSLIQREGIENPVTGEVVFEVVPPEANQIAFRLTPPAFGMGLVQSIPSSAIAANEDPNDANGDGISGRVHWVPLLEDPNAPLRAGRFGFKAQLATSVSFAGDAGLMEVGITNFMVTDENVPNGNLLLLQQSDTVADPEDNPNAPFNYENGQYVGLWVERVGVFQEFLGAPPQTPKSGMTGEAIFNTIGCSKCHVASFTTGSGPGIPSVLANKVIKPYSDFLLHDMGLATVTPDGSGGFVFSGGLGDGIVQGDAKRTEIRTTPLWGLRFRDPLLHDGRVGGGLFADKVTAAIGFHNAPGSEGAASAQAFAALPQSSKNQVIAFLESLGRREFDSDFDNIVGFNDLFDIKACYTGPGNFYTPDSPCAIHDVDQDGDVDVADANLFASVYDGAGTGDCNGNGQTDLVDIISGASQDNNGDSLPDECCLGDLNGDGQRTDADLGLLLSSFGVGNGGDVDGDNDTDDVDLGYLLQNFGTSCR